MNFLVLPISVAKTKTEIFIEILQPTFAMRGKQFCTFSILAKGCRPILGLNWRIPDKSKGKKEESFLCVCVINYENEAKSNDYLGRKAALKVSYLAISVPFSARSLIRPRVRMYAN